MTFASWKRVAAGVLTTAALVAVLAASVNLFGADAPAQAENNAPKLRLLYPVSQQEIAETDSSNDDSVVLRNWTYTGGKGDGGKGGGPSSGGGSG